MSQSNSFDSAWKEIFDVYFKQFVDLCWEEKYSEIDWAKGYKMLDKELIKIARNAPSKNRVIDKLIQVYRKNGEEAWVLIHLEVQGSYDSDFEERMFIYRYRLHDLYRKPIASMAVLTDSNVAWRPSSYRMELWDSYIETRFVTIKLLDYSNRIPELEASTNPFASVILAQLSAMEKQEPVERLISKLELTKRLYKQGLGKDYILNLYKFIDWIMALPPELELKYHQAIEEMEEELEMAYSTTAERVGQRRLTLSLFERRFDDVPEIYRLKIQQAALESLVEWCSRLQSAKTVEAVFEE